MRNTSVSINNNTFLYPDKWKNYNEERIRFSINASITTFNEALLPKNRSKLHCFVMSGEGVTVVPMCSRLNSQANIIYIAIDDACYDNQFIYQFAHEYCHHTINGDMTGDLIGAKWFEEVICEIASLYVLRNVYLYYNNSETRKYYIPFLTDYANKRIEKTEYILNTPLYEYINNNMTKLNEPKLHREIYNIIANNTLDIFLQYPILWNCIIHFRNVHNPIYSNLSLFLFDIYNALPKNLRYPFEILTRRLIGDSDYLKI